MTTHESAGYNQSPEDRLAELLPLIAQDFAPQEGYSLELADVPLSQLESGVDYRKAFQTLFQVPLTDEASFSYSYDPQAEKIKLESVRFGLANPLQENGLVKADSLYLQRYNDGRKDGYVLTYRLDDETIVPEAGADELTDADASSFNTLLSLAGMLELGNGDNPLPTAHALERVDHWYLTESMTVPLSTKQTDQVHEMTITRTRSMVPTWSSPDDLTDSELEQMNPEQLALNHINREQPHDYKEDYALTIRTTSTHPQNETKQNIHELTLLVEDDFKSPRSYKLSEKDYMHYPHPFVEDYDEVEEERIEEYQPDISDLAFFAQVLERQYSDAS